MLHKCVLMLAMMALAVSACGKKSSDSSSSKTSYSLPTKISSNAK